MVMTDPIADLLTRIRNANMVRHEKIEVPASNIKKQIAEILKREGFVRDVEYIEDNKQGIIRIFLKYGSNNERVITGLKRISKPGLRVYAKNNEVPRVLNGLGIAIVSTSQGVLTDKEARQKQTGEKVLNWNGCVNMSRVGKKPLELPAGVTVTNESNTVTVKGPKGELTRTFHPEIEIKVEDNVLVVNRPSDNKEHRALHGTTRSLLGNMVEGVTKGFERGLELVGVGYRAQKSGSKLVLSVGYSHPVEITPETGIEIEVPSQTKIVIKGIDKERVGALAANIRDVRPPEPYKGKGIRYEGEYVRRKEGKTAKK